MFFLILKARVHFFGKESEWKPALAETIDPSILPLEYGGTAPLLADTPFLPAVHRALERDPPRKLALEAADGDTSVSGGNGGATARSMSCLLGRFSLGGGDGSCVVDGDTSSFTSSVSGDYGGGGGGSGGGSPLVVGRDFGSSGGGFKSGGLTRGGGDGLPSASTDRKQKKGWWRGGGGVASKDPPTKAGDVRSVASHIEVEARQNKNGAQSPGWPLRGAANDNAKSTPLRSVAVRAPPLEAPPSVVALPASDDPRTAAPPHPSSSSSSSHVVIVRQQLNDTEGGNDDGEEGEDDRGDLEWVLDVVPGARLAATVAGTFAGATIGAALGAAGFAAGVAEAVIPDQVWAEGVQAFQSAQFMGGWVVGR